MTLGLFLWVLGGFLGGGVWFECLGAGRKSWLVDWLAGWLVGFLQQFILHTVNEFCFALIR